MESQSAAMDMDTESPPYVICHIPVPLLGQPMRVDRPWPMAHAISDLEVIAEKCRPGGIPSNVTKLVSRC